MLPLSPVLLLLLLYSIKKWNSHGCLLEHLESGTKIMISGTNGHQLCVGRTKKILEYEFYFFFAPLVHYLSEVFKACLELFWS